jgi:hypothetical protein
MHFMQRRAYNDPSFVEAQLANVPTPTPIKFPDGYPPRWWKKHPEQLNKRLAESIPMVISTDQGERKGARPDLGTRLALWGFPVAVVLFLEEKTPWAIGALLLSLAALLWRSISWELYGSNRLSRKSSNAVAIALCLMGVVPYAYHVWPGISYEPAQLRLMSPKEVKRAENKISGRIKKLHTDCTNEELNVMLHRAMETQKGNGNKLVDKTEDQIDQECSATFLKDYLPAAVAIRDEMLWRLGKTAEGSYREFEEQLPGDMARGNGASGVLLMAFGGLQTPFFANYIPAYLDFLAERID